MRTIQSGDTILRIKATAFTAHIFKQEFKKDIFKAMTEMLKTWVNSKESIDKIRKETPLIDQPSTAGEMLDLLPSAYELYQITWALNKTQNMVEKLPTLPFDEWLMENDISVMDIFEDVVEEATQGFFRQTNKGIKGI